MNENGVLYFMVMPSNGDVMHVSVTMVCLLQLTIKRQQFTHNSRAPLHNAISRTLFCQTPLGNKSLKMCP